MQEEKSKKQEDEEISIDLSKIMNFFKSRKKSKKEPQEHEKHAAIESKQESEVKESGEEISIDLKSIGSFISKHHKAFLIFLLILIPMFFSVYTRMQTAYLPITKEWAGSTLNNYLKSNIASQISSKYPNLPEQNKQDLINKEFANFLKQNKQQYNQQLEQLAQQYRSFYQYEYEGKSYVYMPDIDPYTYLRQARNLVETGKIYDELKDKKPWNNHMIAPIGMYMGFHIHPYVLAGLYNFLHFFNKKTDLMQAATLFPIILSLLSIIPAFFIGRRIAGNTGGFFTALMVGINQAAVNRTLWGHADTDAYNLFFPLIIVWLFLEAYESKNVIKGSILAALSGLVIGIYSRVWKWWYIFDFILAAISVYVLYYLYINRKGLVKNFKETIKKPALKNTLIIALVFIISSGMFVSLFSLNIRTFTGGILSPLGFVTIKQASKASLWPNVYTTVAELNAASLNQIIRSLGGSILFLIAIVGIILTLIKKDKNEKLDIKYAALLLVWFIATIYASFKGVRFTLLLVPAFAVAFGAAVGMIYKYASKWINRELHINERIAKAIIIILFLLILIKPLQATLYQAKHDIPIINDAWYNALTKIKQESNKDAIINSWWDFGHHFKYFADRAVTFDGASQNTPMAHWIGKTLLTNDEGLAISILRMLDCGSNTAFDVIDKKNNDTQKSVELVYEIIQSTDDEASKILKNQGYDETEIEMVLEKTYCEPPENYFITSDDMIGKAGVWAHFGSWNFERAKIYVNTKSMSKTKAVDFMKDEFNYTNEKAEQVYYEVQSLITDRDANNWIAPWPGYIKGPESCKFLDAENETIQCGGVMFNFTNNEAVVGTPQGVKSPKAVSYYKDGKFNLIEYENNTADIGIAFIPSGDSYKSVLMYPELTGSMFTRLYYFNGLGLEYFEKFDEQTHLTGGKVIVWEVKW